ncbi:putative sulfite oxidase subunit YedZ [Salmonella enterica subsp. enterica serovar Cerro str. FSL R8-0235]|nr:putative sulfite oxidase subunit YedZ [Salmonella enterica subsp. enterica serovar Cerro str. FSL R8-0235]
MRLTAKQITWLKVCLHLAGFLPLLWLFWAINHGGLSADPVKDIQHFTGRTALKFLLATLLVSPLARYAKQPLLIRTRRLLGLWCFVWATLHLTSYALLELGIHNLALLGSELISRPYLTLGIISWLVLLALTLTSTWHNVRSVNWANVLQIVVGKKLWHNVRSVNWANAGKHCITSSILSRSWLPYITCGR